MTEVAPDAVTLVVPVYNESRRLERFAPDLSAFTARRPAGSELVFVDDGSTDGTVELIEDFIRTATAQGQRVRLVRGTHKGKGAAVREGLRSATTPLAGFCDLDLSTPLTDFSRLADAATEAPILAIASRGLSASRLMRHQSAVREFLGRTFNKVVQLALVPGVVDTQCGAKVARTGLWQVILAYSDEDGFAWDVEIIAIAKRLGISVQEVAVEWRHEDDSKVRVARDGAAMLRALPRIRRGLHARLPDRTRVHPHGPIAPLPPDLDLVVSTLATADTSHWWYRSTATFVDWALKQWGDPDGRLIALGAGTGDVTAKLGWAPERTIVADASVELAREAHRRHALEVVRCDPDQVPLLTGSASVVCALDVLQRLRDPRPMLREARRLLGPEGRMIVIVPGHPRLWTAADESVGHVRRYTRRALRAELEADGFEVLFCSHVFSWLVMPVWIYRRSHSGREQFGLEIDSAFVDRCALLLARLERVALNRMTLPVGSSVLCVARAARNTESSTSTILA